jgi:hypothetical protein
MNKIKYKKLKENTNYIIFNDGRVYSIKSKLFLKQTPDKDKYLTVHLKIDNVYKTIKVHRLIAKYFIKNKNKILYMQVNHKDGNKNNNNYSNLEWTSCLLNIRHAIKLGLNKKLGENNGNSKLTLDKAIEIKYLANNYNTSQIANIYNVSQSTIRRIKNKQSWDNIECKKEIDDYLSGTV